MDQNFCNPNKIFNSIYEVKAQQVIPQRSLIDRLRGGKRIEKDVLKCLFLLNLGTNTNQTEDRKGYFLPISLPQPTNMSPVIEMEVFNKYSLEWFPLETFTIAFSKNFVSWVLLII